MYYTDTTSFFADNNSSIGGIDSLTKVMLHLNGNITDSALTPNTFTNVGSVAFTSTNPPFTGAQWAVFNGGGTKQLTAPETAAFDLGSQDWTIDFKINWNSHIADGAFLSQDSGATDLWGVEFATGGTGNRLQWYVLAGGSIVQRIYASFSPVDGTTYHIAFVRNGSTLFIFVNGVSQTTVVANALASVAAQSGTLKVGLQTNLASDPDAQIAEMRFSVGIARWTSNFTPPVGPYTT